MTLMPMLGGSSTPKAVFLLRLLPYPPDHQAEHCGTQAAGGGQLRAEGCAAGGAASSSTLGVCHWERRQWQIPGTSPASACCPRPPLHPVTRHPYIPTCLPEAPPLTYSCLLALLEAMANPGGWHRVTPVAVTLAYSEPVTCLTIYLQGGMLSSYQDPFLKTEGPGDSSVGTVLASQAQRPGPQNHI